MRVQKRFWMHKGQADQLAFLASRTFKKEGELLRDAWDRFAPNAVRIVQAAERQFEDLEPAAGEGKSGE